MLWNRSNDFLKLVLLLTCAWGMLFAAGTVQADEKNAKDETARIRLENFVNLLRDNGFGDLGVYYLQQQKDENKLPESLKPEFDFMMAVQVEASARLERTNQGYLDRYDEAIALLEKYLNENKNGKNYFVAIGFLPNIRLNKTLVYRNLATSGDPSEIDDSKMSEEEKKELEAKKKEFAENKKKYEEASRGELRKNIEFLTKYEKEILAEAKKIDAKDEKQLPKYMMMVGELNSVRMARGDTYYELARTYSEDAKEYTENLDNARKQYKFFWDTYHENQYPIAFRGHMKEARMLILMKKFNGKGEAIEILNDLYTGLKENEEDIFRNIFIEVCTCYLDIFGNKENGLKPNKDQQEILMAAIQSFNPSSPASVLRANFLETTPMGIQMRIAYVKFMDYFLSESKPREAAKFRKAISDDVRQLYALKHHPYMEEVKALHKKFFPQEHIGDEDTDLTFANYKKELKKKREANRKKKNEAQRENLYIELRKFVLKEFMNYFNARRELATSTDEVKKAELQQIVNENPAKIREAFEVLETLKGDALRAKQVDYLLMDRFYRAQLLYAMGQQYEASQCWTSWRNTTSRISRSMTKNARFWNIWYPPSNGKAKNSI